MLATAPLGSPPLDVVVSSAYGRGAGGRSWVWGGGSRYPVGGGGGGSLPGVLWPPTGGPAHGQHPRFVVAEIWANWAPLGGGGGLVSWDPRSPPPPRTEMNEYEMIATRR